MVYVSTPEYFGVYARRMFRVGVRMVGGCCGTTPDHIKRIAAAARMAQASGDFSEADAELADPARADSTSVIPAVLPGATSPVPFAQRGELTAKLGKRFVVSDEVNPP